MYRAAHLNRRTSTKYIMFYYIVISFFSLWIVARSGYLYTGDDILFNINRIEELVATLENKSLISYISTFTSNQVGIATNIFYPNLWLYPFALLRIFFKNPIFSIYLGLGLLNFLTCIISHFTFKAFSGSFSKAFLFTNLYFFSTYRWIDLIHRFDISECIAIAVMPLIFWAFYETCYRDHTKWLWLAIGMALLLYAHILSFLIVTFFLLIIFLINLNKLTAFKTVILEIAKAILVFVLLTIGFLYTFLQTYLSITIQPPRIRDLSMTALKIGTLMQSTFENNIYKNGAHFNLGLMSFIVLLLAILFYSKLSSFYKQIIFLFIFCVLFATTLFPWSLMQTTGLTILQFPWRIFIIANLLFCVLGTKVLGYVHLKHFDFVSIAVITLLGLFTINQFFVFNEENTKLDASTDAYGSLFRHEKLKINQKSYRYLISSNRNRDYTPINKRESEKRSASVYNIVVSHQMLLGKRKLKVKKLQAIPNGVILQTPKISKRSSVSLPFYIYQKHNYKVLVNGKRKHFSVDRYRLLHIQLKDSKSTIMIQYIPSLTQVITIMISILSFSFLLFILLPKL